ncbi:hypothetical protein [[Lactobacillus] timonensis]|nr:hypothetical protein [[Lactobacillus] timonensis]
MELFTQDQFKKVTAKIIWYQSKRLTALAERIMQDHALADLSRHGNC